MDKSKQHSPRGRGDPPWIVGSRGDPSGLPGSRGAPIEGMWLSGDLPSVEKQAAHFGFFPDGEHKKYKNKRDNPIGIGFIYITFGGFLNAPRRSMPGRERSQKEKVKRKKGRGMELLEAIIARNEAICKGKK